MTIQRIELPRNFKELRDFVERYDTKIGLLLMAFGFIIDSITLQRIDLRLENLILVSYLLVALIMIVLINAYHSGKLRYKFMYAIEPYLPLPMQFAFGGLFSGYIIFYSRSASFLESWPFIIMLAALLIGNEFSRTQYARFTYQLTVLYTAIFSFTIFFIPVLVKHMGAAVFVGSGVTSVLLIVGVLYLVRAVARERFIKSKRYVITSVASVFLLFNVLYFTNIIPPIPLSLKDIGVYHSVRRVGNGYVAIGEPAPWYRFYTETSRTVHWDAGSSVYVYSSVFAPTDLQTNIFHQWEVYDEARKVWVKRDRISYSIVGGRDGGYRGYTRKSNLSPGKWRVSVVTDRNQELGRITFMVIESEKTDSQEFIL